LRNAAVADGDIQVIIPYRLYREARTGSGEHIAP